MLLLNYKIHNNSHWNEWVHKAENQQNSPAHETEL